MSMSRQQTLLGGLVPTAEEKKAWDSFADRLVFALTVPLIAHPSWMSIITPKQKMKAQMYRLAKVKNGEDDGLATDYEAMLWLSTASLDAPLDRHAYNIYAHVFRKFYPDKSDFMGNDGKVLDIHMEEPLLRELKRKIYNSQKEALKQRKKLELSKLKSEEKCEKPKTKKTILKIT